MAAIPPQGEVVTISPADFGNGKMAALDRWGTSFVWCRRMNHSGRIGLAGVFPGESAEVAEHGELVS
jgi:hypothetical protein